MHQIGINALLTRLKQSVASARVSHTTLRWMQYLTQWEIGVCSLLEKEIYAGRGACARAQEAM